jgi:hypothetical protein
VVLGRFQTTYVWPVPTYRSKHDVSPVKYPVTVTGGPSLHVYGLNGYPHYWPLNQDGGGPAGKVVNDPIVTV